MPETSKKDRYLIYGHLFLTGKNPRKKRSEEFLTPLLYTPCKIEREGKNLKCSLLEETISLNTGALAELMKFDDEDEVEHLFEGLIDVVPDLPLTKDNMEIFITTLRSIIPGIEVELGEAKDTEDENDTDEETKKKQKQNYCRLKIRNYSYQKTFSHSRCLTRTYSNG